MEPHLVQELVKSEWPASQKEQEANCGRDDKEATEQIYCRMLLEIFLITTGEVQGDMCDDMGYDPFLQCLRSSHNPPLRLFLRWVHYELVLPSYLRVVCVISLLFLQHKLPEKLWRWIGFRSAALTPAGLRDCCTSFCFFYLWNVWLVMSSVFCFWMDRWKKEALVDCILEQMETN